MILTTSEIEVPAISETLEEISVPSFSDILQRVGTFDKPRDIFAEHSRNAWHAQSTALARCDLSEEHCHMFPKVGLRVMAVWKRTVKGPTLADIKADDEKIPLFANRVSVLIRQVLGEHLRHGDFAVVTTPRRRHKERNFACLVAEQIAQRIGVPYRPDVAIAHTKQRINVDFEPGTIPPETNLIVFDDFVTTGSTLGAMNRLLAPMGKNCMYFVGVDNQ